MSDCPDPFHQGDSDGEEYVVPTQGAWAMTGFRCPTCGFQTVTTETYVPGVKPCPKCGKDFEGMSDVLDELCDDCFQANLDAWVAKIQSCEHEPAVGMCKKCGTGR